MNTNLAGSSRPCLRIQRRRARATSARSCSAARGLFLTVTLCRSKNRQTAVRLPGIRCLRIAATISSKVRSGVRLSEPAAIPRAPPTVTCSRRSALLWRSSVTPALQPPHRGTGAQAEAFGRFPPRCPGRDGFDHAFPQVIRIGFGIDLVPPTPNQCHKPRSLTHNREPRFNSAAKRSKSA